MTDTLLKVCENKGLRVLKKKFVSNCNGLLYGNKIAINEELSDDEALQVLAHEVAHAYLHYDKGNTILSPMREAYEEQADRAAQLILDILKALN